MVEPQVSTPVPPHASKRGLNFVDIDHIVVRVEYLEQSKVTYERLGFTVTPLRAQVDQAAWVDATETGRETRGQATINQRQVLFRPFPGRDDIANFIAFIAIEDQLNTPPEVTQMMSYLYDTEGPRAIVLNTADVHAAREEMQAAGFEAFKPVKFETGWMDEERDTFVPITSSASVPIHGQVPFMFDPFQTWTLDGYTYEPWTRHENGAQYIAGVNGITRNVRRDAEVMADRVFGTEIEFESEDVAILRKRDLFLRVMSPEGFAQVYPGLDHSVERILPHTFGLTFAVESLDRLTALFDDRDVTWVRTRDGVSVPRLLAHNTLLEFIEA